MNVSNAKMKSPKVIKSLKSNFIRTTSILCKMKVDHPATRLFPISYLTISLKVSQTICCDVARYSTFVLSSTCPLIILASGIRKGGMSIPMSSRFSRMLPPGWKSIWPPWLVSRMPSRMRGYSAALLNLILSIIFSFRE